MLALGCWLPGVVGGRFQLISTAGSQLQGVRGAPGRAGVTVAWPTGLDLGIAVIISSPVATAAYQAPLSMGFSRQEYWSGVALPSPGLQSMRVQRVGHD